LSQKLGILGGTFNPIHYGHLAAAEEVRERLKLDRVLFIPSFHPPHKQEDDVPSAAHRMEMVRIATSENATFEPSDIEIKRGGKSYTIDTIEALKRAHPDADLYFITGVDSFLDIQTWSRWERLLSLCTFVVLSRPGYRFADLLKIDFLRPAGNQVLELDREQRVHVEIHAGTFTVYLEMIPLYDISSTDIRRRVKEGRSIKYLLPEAVETYIINNKLYA
jgi:nicotinate-nucleotide adenylyltransferase